MPYFAPAADATKLPLAGGTLTGDLLASADGGATIGGAAANRFQIRAYAIDSGSEGLSGGELKWGGASGNGMGMQSGYLSLGSTVMLRWSSGNPFNTACDIGLYRTAAGVLEVNSSTAGTYRDLKLRDLYVTGATYLVRASAALTDNAAGNVATLTNAPASGNPTKWIAIDDNGTARKIPCW